MQRSRQDADFPTFFSLTAAALGVVYTLAGRIAEAMPLLARALAQATTTDRIEAQVFCRLSLGEAQVLAIWKRHRFSPSRR